MILGKRIKMMLSEKKLFLFSLMLSALYCTTAYAISDLLFSSDFDTFDISAQTAKKNPKSKNFSPPSLLLRMHSGIHNSDNSLCMSNGESCIYFADGNFNPKQGTVSLWITPKNWKPSEKYFQMFFAANINPKCRFLIYKFINPGELRFLIQLDQKDYCINIPLNDADWAADRWHKIDAVWNEKSMSLYLDGKLAKQRQYTGNPIFFPFPVNFPGCTSASTFQLGVVDGFSVNRGHKTAFDELKIYATPIPASQILADYEKICPPTQNSRASAPVPAGKSITPDGIITQEEWEDATLIPVLHPVGNMTSKYIPYSQFYLKHDAQNLYIAAEVFAPAHRFVTVNNDIASIWKDDSAEVHLKVGDFRSQFIINSNGNFFDAAGVFKDNLFSNSAMNSDWTGNAKVCAKRFQNKWSMELSIPKEKLNLDKIKSFSGNFCVSSYGDFPGYAVWSPGGNFYFDQNGFGNLKLSDRSSAIRFETFHISPNGQCDIQVSGPSQTAVQYKDTQGQAVSRPRELSGKNWRLNLSVGRYYLQVSSEDFLYDYSFVVNPPLRINYACYPSRNYIEVFPEFGNIPQDVYATLSQGKLTAVVELKNADGKIFSQQKAKLAGGNDKIVLPLPLNLPSGQYEIKLMIEGTSVPLTASKNLRVPDRTPYQTRVGVDHSVPAPWLKIEQLDNHTFAVWNRQYSFGAGPFPTRIVSGEDIILAESPVILADTGAGVFPVRWRNFRVVEHHDDVIKFAGTGDVSGLKFNWVSEFFFDGAVHCKITMLPAFQKIQIKHLSLNWKMPHKFAEKLLEPLYQEWNCNEGESFSFPYSHPGDFILWLMGANKGLCWWPRSNANWKLQPGSKPFTVSRTGETVSVKAEFINTPVLLTKPAVYSMAFMATPGRPLPENWRDFNYGWGGDITINHENACAAGHSPSMDLPDYSCEPWTGLIPFDPQKFRKFLDKKEKQGLNFYVYTMPTHIASIEESYDWFYHEWRQRPGLYVGKAYERKTGKVYEPEAACPHTGAGDLYVWRAARILDNFPKLAGIYYDITEGRICYNTLHGCGGIDAFGQEYGDSTLWGEREYFIRIQRVLKQRGKRLFLHAHNRFVPFVHGLGDFWLPGEQYYADLLKYPDDFFCKYIPLREYQSAYNPDAHGVGIVLYAHLINFQKNIRNNDEIHTLMYLTPVVLHDILPTPWFSHGATVERLWNIRHDTGIDKAMFRGYWFDDTLKSNVSEVYASWYKWEVPSPYSRMLVIGNIGKTEKKVDLSIDWKKFGLDPQNVQYYDLWNNIPLSSLENLTVKGQNFLLIGIK